MQSTSSEQSSLPSPPSLFPCPWLVGEQTALCAKAQGLVVEYVPETTSTNLMAKEMAAGPGSAKPFEGGFFPGQNKIYITDNQTAGRGRYDRKWISPPPGTALLMSWAWQLDSLPSPQLTELIGDCLYRAAKSIWPMGRFSVKPPNDLYLAGKKVAGLLLENISQGNQNCLIIGLGLNVFAYPHELDTATSLVEGLATGEQGGGSSSDGEQIVTKESWNAFLNSYVKQVPGFFC